MITDADMIALALTFQSSFNAHSTAAPSAAETIYNNLRVGANSTDIRAVKNAFESAYTDLGISCADVGGLWDGFQGKYYVGMEPCVEAEEPTSNAPVQNVSTPCQIDYCTFHEL